jgi:DNA-binding CsgD family transcriptional regulator
MSLTPEQQARLTAISKTLEEIAEKLLTAPPTTRYELGNLLDQYAVKLLDI